MVRPYMSCLSWPFSSSMSRQSSLSNSFKSLRIPLFDSLSRALAMQYHARGWILETGGRTAGAAEFNYRVGHPVACSLDTSEEAG